MRRWTRNDSLVSAALVLAAILLWKLRIIDPAVTPYRLLSPNADYFTQIYPMSFRAAAWIRAGRLPLWNPFQNCGHPFLATGIYGVLYPFNFFYLLLPTEAAIEATVVLHLAAAGVLMYAFARTIDLGRAAATVSAVSFMFSGFVVSEATWFPPAMSAAAWLPLALLAVERIVRTRAAVWSVALGTAVALAFLAGWPQTWLYSMYAVAAYAAVRTVVALRSPTERRHVLTVICLLGLGLAIGAGLMAVQLLPGLELQSLGPRRAGGLSAQQTLILTPTSSDWLFKEVVDSSPGHPRRPYVGILAFALLPLSLFVRSHRPWVMGSWGLVLLSLGVALSSASPVMKLYLFLPGATWFRAPIRILYLYAFGAAVLSGIGYELLASRRDSSGRRGRLVMFGLVAAVALSATLALPMPSLSRLYLALGTTLTCAALLVPHRLARGIACAAILAILCSDLFFAVRNPYLHPYHDTSVFDAARPLLNFVKARQGFERAYIYTSLEDPALMSKQGTLGEIYSVRDYEPLSLLRYDRFYNLLGNRRPPAFTFTGQLHADPTAPSFRLIDLMSVRYIIAPKYALDFRRALNRYWNKWRIVRWAPPGGSVVYENRDVLPRAYVAHGVVRAADEDAALAAVAAPEFDPWTSVILEGMPPSPDPGGALGVRIEPAELVRYEPTAVTVESQSVSPGYLVLTDTFFPGWKATVDGKPAPIFQANYLFRAVPVGAGKHTITFEYAPRSFAIGAAITATTLAAIVVLFAAAIWRARVRPMPV